MRGKLLRKILIHLGVSRQVLWTGVRGDSSFKLRAHRV